MQWVLSHRVHLGFYTFRVVCNISAMPVLLALRSSTLRSMTLIFTTSKGATFLNRVMEHLLPSLDHYTDAPIFATLFAKLAEQNVI